MVYHSLRIIHINDVYELDNFPRLKTLIDERCANIPARKSLVVCAGDFLAPSLLSSLDRGASMVDIFNAIGMDYVCLGNHEADVGAEALVQRIQQSRFIWLNSNMDDLSERLNLPQASLSETGSERVVPYHIVTVGTGSNAKRVALLGLLTEDSSLYRATAFGGARIEPLLPRARELIDTVCEDVDLILPLTHQGIVRDRQLAEEMNPAIVPLLLGGHDHEPYLEQASSGCQIVKTGMDAQKAAIIDIEWAEDLDRPAIRVEMVDTVDFQPNAALQLRVENHKVILRELDRAKLFAIADWTKEEEFSTQNNRLGPSTGTTAMCSMIRMGLRCEVALLNAGCVRAGRAYHKDEHFTWSDLKAEMPFATKMCVASLPGRVLEHTLQHSRQFAPRGIAKGGYLHTSRTTKCQEDGTIENILGQSFDPEREYLTAFPHEFLTGIDNHKPLLDWVNSETRSSAIPDDDSAIPAKLIIVEVLSALFWLRLGTFDEVAGEDGILCKQDLRKHMAQIYGGDEEIANLMVDNVFSVADRDGSGDISKVEQMIVHFVAGDMLRHVVTSDEMRILTQVVERVLGKDTSPPTNDGTSHDHIESIASHLLQSLDLRGTGSIQREEILQALGSIARKDLLE